MVAKPGVLATRSTTYGSVSTCERCLVGASSSSSQGFSRGSCGIKAICVCWIGGEELRHYRTQRRSSNKWNAVIDTCRLTHNAFLPPFLLCSDSSQDWACTVFLKAKYGKQALWPSTAIPLTPALEHLSLRLCIQGSRICVVMFIHAGLTCVECCKEAYIAGIRLLRRLLAKHIGRARSFIWIEWETSYSSSYIHPKHMLFCSQNIF